ncbi:MAG: peptidoglycan DD-metalloendopeptidase family protein [Methylovulum sp.]|nr:peptidoglycan DD-metalloendopeptidase family protein [Methylovulum sp.]
MRKKIVFYFFLSLSASILHAENFDENNQLDPASSSQSDAYQNHTDLQATQNVLEEIEKRYGETAALLKSLHRQIEQKRQVLNKIRRDMQSYQNEIDKEHKALVNQVRAAYLMGQQEKLKLMLNQQDPALSSRMMVYYEYFNRERLAKLAAIEKSIEHLDQLDKQKQTETDLLEQSLTQKKSEQAILNEFRKQRAELLAQTADGFSSDGQRSGQLKENENKLKALMASLHDTDEAKITEAKQAGKVVEAIDNKQPVKDDFSTPNGNFSTLKGKLPWPARGKVAQNFASLQSKDIQNGVLIEASEGVEVHAVAKGKVAFAEWMQSYGFLMIIDHGEGYMTLYAFNQSLYKHKNDPVAAGEVIASVGQSGGRSQSGLYFGIRKQGMPIDPLEWFRTGSIK